MTPRPHVAPERRTQILDAAMRVFARLGFHKARMEDIAQDAGLSKGTLYLYFRSKDALIQALLERLFAREKETLERVLAARDLSVPERLERLAEETLTHVLPFRRMMPLLYEFYALATRHKTIRTALQEIYREYTDLLATLIQEGVARGELRPVDPRAAALSLVAHIEGLILLWVIAPEAVDLERDWHTSVGLLLQGLRAQPNDAAFRGQTHAPTQGGQP